MLFWFFFSIPLVFFVCRKCIIAKCHIYKKRRKKKNQNCVIFRLLELIQDRSMEFTRACRSSHLASLKLVLSLRHPEFRMSRIILLIFSSFRPIQTWHHDCLDYAPPTIVEMKRTFFPESSNLMICFDLRLRFALCGVFPGPPGQFISSSLGPRFRLAE